MIQEGGRYVEGRAKLREEGKLVDTRSGGQYSFIHATHLLAQCGGGAFDVGIATVFNVYPLFKVAVHPLQPKYTMHIH